MNECWNNDKGINNMSFVSVGSKWEIYKCEN